MTRLPALDTLRGLVDGTSPALAAEPPARIDQEHRHLQAMLGRGVRVYGHNTEVGHRDHVARDSVAALWQDVVASHQIGRGPAYPALVARHIGAAKWLQWRAGGSGVSPALFSHLGRLLADPSFTPQVPASNSYSAGDVIPATHWAVQVLAGSARTPAHAGAPEIMPLINGSFVHVGVAAAGLQALEPLAQRWRALSGQARALSRPDADTQAAVSVRASLDVADALDTTLARLAAAVDEALGAPSCNPLIALDRPAPVSQASFLALPLALEQSRTLEALLLAMWTSVSRVQYLLGEDTPAGSGAQGLGLIQHPKQMMALLEKARLHHGRRTFASGGQTSNGVEDLWSFGLLLSESLLELAQTWHGLNEIEAEVYRRVGG
jgi:histidine ammonia-lyase